MKIKDLTYYIIIYTPCLLIINLGLGSQEIPITFAGMPINQLLNWITIAGAAFILRQSYKNRYWPLVLVLLVIMAKVVSKIFGDPQSIHLFYKAMLCTLFFVMGFLYTKNHYYKLLYKPLLIICSINIMWMIFQLLNLGTWTQFLSTESTLKYGEKITHDILFVPYEYLKINVIQARPSGLLRANNIVSGVLLFVFAVHLSGRRILLWGSLVLCAMIVLTSARVVYFSTLITGIFLIIKGSNYQKKNILYCLGITLIFLWIYSILFPGLFQKFWQADNLMYSFLIRFWNIADNISIMNLSSLAKQQELLLGAELLLEKGQGEEVLSAYVYLARLAKYWIYILILFLYIGWRYYKNFKILNYFHPELKSISILCFIVFMIYPAAVPMIHSPYLWYIGGFGLFPLLVRSRILNPVKNIILIKN